MYLSPYHDLARILFATGTSLLLTLLLGPPFIRLLKIRCREPNVSDSPEVRRLHQAKEATPTMGGLFLMAAFVVGVLLFGDLTSVYLQAALLVAFGLTAIGMVDDWAKVNRKSTGLPPRSKLLLQTIVALAAALWLHAHTGASDTRLLAIPLTHYTVPLGIGFIPLAVIVIVGSSNAVNLTDGLDGLAAGCLVFAVAAMGLVAYVVGHADWARSMGLISLEGVDEMAVPAGAMLGAVLGFLRFNWHPARVFMGDTGSLPLGGLLGLLAVAARQELLLVLIGGVFVAETVSVILQVGYFRWCRRRIFLCAPLHHHFQFKGWTETRVVTRFWFAGAFCAILGLVSLAMPINGPAATPAVAVSHDVASENAAR